MERKKLETLIFTPGGLRIECEVSIPSQIRLIDALNLAYGNFYAISNAKLFTTYDEANAIKTFPLLALNKFFIMCAHPIDTPKRTSCINMKK